MGTDVRQHQVSLELGPVVARMELNLHLVQEVIYGLFQIWQFRRFCVQNNPEQVLEFLNGRCYVASKDLMTSLKKSGGLVRVKTGFVPKSANEGSTIVLSDSRPLGFRACGLGIVRSTI